jgi:ribose transport system permease protein
LRYSFFIKDRTTIIVYLVLVGLIAATSLLSDIFLTTRNIQNLLRQVVPLGLVSVGQTFAILTAGIDLSIGSVVSMASCLTTGMILGREPLIFPVVALVIVLALFQDPGPSPDCDPRYDVGRSRGIIALYQISHRLGTACF